jgi:pyruvate dehydrogenase E2 component (dihydrolipoamide acetyltransferase)
MAKDFKLPDLGEGIHEAQVVNLMIKEGDTVREDQMIMEVETDKASVELPVPFGGKVARLNVKVGDTVQVGTVLLSIAEEGEAAPAPPTRPAAAPAAVSRPGATVPATRGGDGPFAAARPAAVAEAPIPAGGPIPAAPAIRRLAREAGVDLRLVRGTGPGGRIVREDVERYQLAGASGTGAPPAPARPAAPAAERPAPRPAETAAPAARPAPAETRPAAAAEPLPDFSQWGPVRREPVSQIRKTIARQMARSVSTIPHVTHGDEVDITDLEAFRKEQSAIFADKGAKLTLTAFVVKAVAGALRQYPQFNASFDDHAWEMIYKDYVHIGIAVDSPRGLMVPVLRDADRKGLVTLSKELREIGEKAREFKLDVAQMRGGTFTVTNVGALGGTMSTPIINYPEVAILGMGKLEWKAVVRDGKVLPRQMLPLFLSFDHRVIDGADGARFIRTVMSFLESPLNLLLVS